VSYDCIGIVREGRVTIVTINRPASLNALNAKAHQELTDVFDDFAADDGQWVAIITGAGPRAFCAGNDLKAMAETGDNGFTDKGFAGVTSRFDLTKPLIAAVNGLAVGGGFELALSCDIVVAAEGASFGLPEPRVGLAALAGGLHRLPRAIGLARALPIILTAERVSARRGYELGFVYRVVPDAELLIAARAIAGDLCKLSPLAVRASKDAILRGLAEHSVKEALDRQHHYLGIVSMLASEDCREGQAAFAEKRQPNWSGR
jgi:enoyl-CoA hydratase/carnithine racemase